MILTEIPLIIVSILFWSVILSFIPTTLYLMLINPPIYEAHRAQSLGIYIIHGESKVDKHRSAQIKWVGAIYGVCVIFMGIVFWVNAVRTGRLEVTPFDILSAISVVFFWISVLAYFPFAMYLFMKNPWRLKEGGVCLNRIYIGYGICILIFSMIFANQWLHEKEIWLRFSDFSKSLLIIIFCSLIISYLPILTYILIVRARHPLKLHAIHPNTIFVIYFLCFFVFSGVYLYSWLYIKLHKIPESKIEWLWWAAGDRPDIAAAQREPRSQILG